MAAGLEARGWGRAVKPTGVGVETQEAPRSRRLSCSRWSIGGALWRARIAPLVHAIGGARARGLRRAQQGLDRAIGELAPVRGIAAEPALADHRLEAEPPFVQSFGKEIRSRRALLSVSLDLEHRPVRAVRV